MSNHLAYTYIYIIASVSSSRAPKPSVAYFHGAVPAKGTCVANAVPLHPGPNFYDGNTRIVRYSRRSWSEFGDGNPR